jgi:hypothetical protein
MPKLVAICVACVVISAWSNASMASPSRSIGGNDSQPPPGGQCGFHHYIGSYRVVKVTMVRAPTSSEAAIHDVTYQFFVGDQVKRQYQADLMLYARKISLDASTYIKRVSDEQARIVHVYGDDLPKIGASYPSGVDVEISGWHCSPVIERSIDSIQH